MPTPSYDQFIEQCCVFSGQARRSVYAGYSGSDGKNAAPDRRATAGTDRPWSGDLKNAQVRLVTDLTVQVCLAARSAVMGSSLPIMVTKRADQIECKRMVKWSAVFQLVFQLKTKTGINNINQLLTYRIQITPAHQMIKKDVHGRLFFA
ncbi:MULTISPECIES: hypothetical protein [unclassified Pseudomonas]|uniref:hypothetical protein n=1 Tax=unclassified Pseudomonas TaxID=196821 RepID=UPI0015A98D6A|nr:MULTISPECIES: hypothetical protein [unclassified Pseudomonas]